MRALAICTNIFLVTLLSVVQSVAMMCPKNINKDVVYKVGEFKVQDQDGLEICHSNVASIMAQSVLQDHPEVSYLQIATFFVEKKMRSSPEEFGNALVESGNIVPYSTGADVCEAYNYILELQNKNSKKGILCKRKSIKLEMLTISPDGAGYTDSKNLQEEVIKKATQIYDELHKYFNKKIVFKNQQNVDDGNCREYSLGNNERSNRDLVMGTTASRNMNDVMSLVARRDWYKNYDQTMASVLELNCSEEDRVELPTNLTCKIKKASIQSRDYESPFKQKRALASQVAEFRQVAFENFNSKRAFSVGLCTRFLTDKNFKYRKTKDCSGPDSFFHSVAVVGYQCNKNGKLEYILQNSWGIDFDSSNAMYKNYEFQPKSGLISIDEDVLMQNILDFEYLD